MYKEYRTQKLLSYTPGQLLVVWVTVCWQVYHLST